MIELARQDAYDSLAPDRGSVYLTTDQARVFDVQQGMRDFYREFNTLMDNIQDTNAYKQLLQNLLLNCLMVVKY